MGDYERKYYMYVPKSQDAYFHNIIVMAIPSIILPQRLVILHANPVAWFEPSFTCSKRDGGRGRDATLCESCKKKIHTSTAVVGDLMHKARGIIIVGWSFSATLCLTSS